MLESIPRKARSGASPRRPWASALDFLAVLVRPVVALMVIVIVALMVIGVPIGAQFATIAGGSLALAFGLRRPASVRGGEA
jgi:hypothetical protein